MIKSWFMLLSVLVLTGCAASGRKTARQTLPADWDSELGPVHEIETVGVLYPTNSVGAAPSNQAAAPPRNARPPIAYPENGMVALSLWAEHNGIGPVRLLPLNPKPAYTIKTTFGNFTVREGSLAAYWNRLEVRLGFAPKLFGNQIFLHALDIKKVLEPLARGTSVATRSDRLVVIDAGHGGSNTGTRSVVTGRYEKDYTLDWARRLAPLLQQSGWQVVLTRTNDATLSLAERVAFAEAQRADLFISLHFNAAGTDNQTPAGLETYYLTPTGMPSSLTRGYSDDARAKFPNNAFDDQNLRYAVRIHQALLQVNGGKDRGVRRARFLDVLQGHNRPAVLVEGGYLSNPEEARRVADAGYRQKLAEAVAKALE